MPDELPTFDPAWAERFNTAHRRFGLMMRGASPAAARTALEAMHEAHEAQFRSVADYEAFLFGSAKDAARLRGFDLQLRSFGPAGRIEDVRARYADAMTSIDEAARARSRPPPSCPDDLDAFRDPLPPGRTRHLGQLELPQRSGRTATYLAAAERSAAAAHVCVVHLGEGTPPMNVIEALATKIYARHLAPQARSSSVWRRLLGRGGGYRPD